MRSLHNPGKIVSSVLSPVTDLFSGGKSEVAAPKVTSPADDKAASDEAARQKREEELKSAGKRTGTSQTLLTPIGDVSTLGSRRRSLLGGR